MHSVSDAIGDGSGVRENAPAGAKLRRWYVGRTTGHQEIGLLRPGHFTRWGARRELAHIRRLLPACADGFDVYRVRP